MLPRKGGSLGVPPIKCQGIKTKLVPFIFGAIQWNPGDAGRWIEPFMGSGVVGFNLQPERALFFDTNRHIIELYQAIQSGQLTSEMVRDHLESENPKLRAYGAEYYYEVRKRFNTIPSSLDFLFLNRCCFNGVMRFNSKGSFNVPFGHKPERFSKSYVTKIVNQVKWVAKQMQGRDWEFRTGQWHEALNCAMCEDFVYIDPPYIGRHTDYFNQWTNNCAEDLAFRTKALACGFALSMWYENKYRHNKHVDDCWEGIEIRLCSHFYYVGSNESLRNQMDEALIIAPGYATPNSGKQQTRVSSPFEQIQLVFR